MRYEDFCDPTLRGEVEDALAEPMLASLRRAGAPVIVIAQDPSRMIFANASAQAFFGAEPAALEKRLLQGAEPGGRRILDLSRALLPGAAPRLERLRFFLGSTAETVTALCRRAPRALGASGAPLFAMAALGVRAPGAPTSSAPSNPKDSAHNVLYDALPKTCAQNISPDTQEKAGAANAVDKPWRFVWRSDKADRILSIDPELDRRLGSRLGDLVGCSLLSLAHRFDPNGALTNAVLSRKTFSGVKISLPVGERSKIASAILGAAAYFDEKQAFAGYRGFGVLSPQDETNLLETNLATAGDAPTADGAPKAQGPQEILSMKEQDAPVSSPIDLGAPRPLVQPSLLEDPERDHRPDAAPSVSAQASTDVDHAASKSITDQASDENHAQDEDIKRAEEKTAQESLAEKVFAPTRQEALSPQDCEIPSPPTDAAEPLSETAKPPEESNIVPLRFSVPVGANPLSPGECRTFAEIARSLGVKGSDESEPIPATNAQSPNHASLAASHAEIGKMRWEDEIRRNSVALLDRLPIGVVVARGGVPIYANRTMLDLLDYDDIDAFHGAGGLDAMFSGQAPENGAVEIRTRHGETLRVDARIQASMWDDLPALLVSIRRAATIDPAPLRAMEAELRQRNTENRELHAILDTATDGVAVVDAEGHILSINRSGEALFGSDADEAIGTPIASLFARESQETLKEYLASVRSGGVASLLNDGREIVARAKGGGDIPVFVTLGRLGPSDPAKFCIVMRDLTPWKRAERELGEATRSAERASALKSDLLAKISHEIRTPLNAILGFAEVMIDERFGPIGINRYRDYMRDIHKSGAHVLSLVNDLLDLSKIEAGKMELNFSSVNANAVVSDCVAIMQPQAHLSRIIVRLSLTQKFPNIVCDERSLKQIILNLLSNAIKFNAAGGQVIVSTALTDAGHAVIRVKDTGIGMNDADMEVAMEPFRQVATARPSGGTGLGLPLTKALVEANRASFVLKSKKDEGTLAEVIFPPTRVLAD